MTPSRMSFSTQWYDLSQARLSSRTAWWAVAKTTLAVGLLLLILGLTVATVRHERAVNNHLDRLELVRDRYAAGITEAAGHPPHFEAIYTFLTRARFLAMKQSRVDPAFVVPSESASQIWSNARAAVEHKRHHAQDVAVLIVRQVTPGRASLRLEATRRAA